VELLIKVSVNVSGEWRCLVQLTWFRLLCMLVLPLLLYILLLLTTDSGWVISVKVNVSVIAIDSSGLRLPFRQVMKHYCYETRLL